MDYSSRQTLLQLFKRITKWRRRLSVHENATIPWGESHLSNVFAYILNLRNINSESKLLKELPSHSHILRETVTSSAEELQEVTFFVEELQEFFIMPRLYQLYDEGKAAALKKTNILAVFINFLIQLLHHKMQLTDSFEDKIEVLKKELRFLLTFLGDTTLQGVKLGEVNNLLAEFEDVANEAGSLIFSFIFTTRRAVIATRLDKTFASLLEHIDHLKGKITTFLIPLPHIRKANITPKNTSADSFFIVDSLLYDLDDLLKQEDNLITDVKGQIKILHQGLLLSKFLLKDMRVQQHLEIQKLKGLVIQIRDVAYEAEYLINSFLVGDNPLWYFTLRFPDVTHKIKFIGTQLQEFQKSFDSETFKVAMDYSAQLSLQAKTNSEVDDIEVGLEDNIIVGQEDDTIHILNHLLGGTERLQIITIFGMPGLGKTTLAKKLYNHPSVSYYFDRRSWCVVSQTYLRKSLLIGILISLESELDKVKILDMEEESLGEHIYKSLKGRRYLIIMDDVWDLNSWNDFRRYFPNDGNGSRILFTSRNKDWTPPNSIIYELPPLSNDHSWELLHKKVFHDKPCPRQLLGVGKKLAQNCKGLPLSIVVVAGILSIIKKEESAWENVVQSLASYILSNQKNFTMQILELSYKHLPDHLKACFLYFATFPEDAEICVKKLKCLWIAEGFICKEENKRAETVAEEYLLELIDRSLVIVAKRRSDGGAKACVVHDLLHDFCLKIAEEQNFLKLMDDNCSIYTMHHCVCINMKLDRMNSRDFILPFGPHVRSFSGHFQGRDLPLCVPNMKLLKVLNVPINELGHGDEITYLVHLRYLAIPSVPISVSSLLNLEFLIVTTILGGRLSISKMVKLRYLISRVPLLLEKDCNGCQTNNLEFLSAVDIQNVEDEEMLKCSPHLRKLRCRSKHSVDQQGVYRCPDFSFFNQLESLKIISGMYVNHDFHILNQLESLNITSSDREDLDTNFLRELKRLDLMYDRHHNLSSETGYNDSDLHLDAYIESLKRATLIQVAWTDIKLPSNIRKLTLDGLWLPWRKMSIIGGLPNLQVLKLENQAFVGERWDTGDGEFQNLRFLKLQSATIHEWNVTSSEHFPKLQRLVLWYCRKLKEIPYEIGEIATLQLIEVKSGEKSLAESAIKIQEVQLDMGNEEFNVSITNKDTLNF